MPTRQFEKIDVLVVINDTIAMIIEDKTKTEQHSGQLARYREILLKKFPRHVHAAVYFKTGDQSDYDSYRAEHYGVFRRSDFLNILNDGRIAGVANDIFLAYLDYLQDWENRVQAFRNTPMTQWTLDCWTGFFIELQKRFLNSRWGYVNNPAGGFLGFRFAGHRNKYLQLEKETVCFKIEVQDPVRRTRDWEVWHRAIRAQPNARIGQRGRKTLGQWMTVARWDGDYRKHDNDILDLPATVELLKQIETLHGQAITALDESPH